MGQQRGGGAAAPAQTEPYQAQPSPSQLGGLGQRPPPPPSPLSAAPPAPPGRYPPPLPAHLHCPQQVGHLRAGSRLRGSGTPPSHRSRARSPRGRVPVEQKRGGGGCQQRGGHPQHPAAAAASGGLRCPPPGSAAGFSTSAARRAAPAAPLWLAGRTRAGPLCGGSCPLPPGVCRIWCF